MTQGPRSGQSFGPYEIRALVGRGGMGEVYEAFDNRRGRTVALKLLPAAIAQDASFRARFEHEAAIAARLDAPHVIPIHDFGEIDGTYFIDMRLVRDGRNLREVLQEDGPLTPERASGMVAQVASALDAAHRDGLVHRDVKPENILVTGDDFVYLVDFGIARADGDQGFTQAGSAVGSLSYMAPERFEDAPDAPSGDVYALGCVFFQMLTGAPPYGSGTIGSMVRAHSIGTPPSLTQRDPRLPHGIDEVLHVALSKDPALRQATAGEFARQVQDALTATTVADPQQPTVIVDTGPYAPTGQLHAPAQSYDQTVYDVPQFTGATAPAAPTRRTRRTGQIIVGALAGLLVAAVALFGISRALDSSGGEPADAGATSGTTAAMVGAPGDRSSPAESPGDAHSEAPTPSADSSDAPTLPSDADECPTQPHGDQYATVTAPGRNGPVHCSYAENVYQGYRKAKTDDGKASFTVFNDEYTDDDHPDGMNFDVLCAPQGEYVVCRWLVEGDDTPTGSKEYILRK